MLLRNDLIEYAGATPRTVRILWIDRAQTSAYIFQLHQRGAAPELVALAQLSADLHEGRARLLLTDPYQVAIDTTTLPPRHREVRDRAWAIVQELIQDEPGIYQARVRGRLVLELSERHGVSHPSVYRYLRRFWERGQNENALLPDYKNSGAPGKIRGSNANIKRGRPRKPGSPPGVNADPVVRSTFRAAVARYAATHAEFSRRGAYRQMIEDFFKARGEAALPTFGQFNYWIQKDIPATLR